MKHSEDARTQAMSVPGDKLKYPHLNAAAY
jgi:hypothetical protein